MILQRIKVIELAGLAPAPFCGKILSDHGAAVVRIDKHASEQYSWLDAHKRSIILDLKKASGVNVVKKLCESYDVLIDPYRPGVMEKLGIGPADVMKKNPGLIYARLSGFGQYGPLSHAAGHDINYVALSGVLSMLGRKGTVPTPPINLLADFAGGGLLCAFGIILALFDRTITGLGKVVDLSMAEGAAYVSSWLYSSRGSYVWGQPRGENILDSGSHFYDSYETKDGKYMSVGAIETPFFEQLLKGLELNSEEVIHIGNFSENKALFSAKFKEKTQDQWIKIFENLDACVIPVLTMDEAPLHPHNIERKNFYKVQGRWEPTPAPKITDIFGNISDAMQERLKDNPPCPMPGQHSFDILHELGYSEQEIQELCNSGTVVTNQVKSVNSKL